ncbi:MAG: hypothetical protein LBT11_07305 [Treponema sp.]|jgi:hypothetical protein|nr:hypothetical protein [Treponema sp.]
MDKHINFEDNIFIINTRIRMIRDMLLLDADPDFFLMATLDDTVFIDRSLARLLELLEGNTRYIDREAQFHNLAETEASFVGLLTAVQNGENTLSALKFPVMEEKIAGLLQRSGERRKRLAALTREMAGRSVPEPVVSSRELAELLNGLV